MVLKINSEELNNIAKQYYKTKFPLLVYGTFGIGKSMIIRNVAQGLAKEKERIFFDWDRSTKEEKDIVYANPEKYFSFIDLRLSQFDASDFKLPDFKEGKETIIWKIPFWEKYMTQPNSDGILFLDEFNLCPPIVMSSFYQILHDRVVGENKIGDNWSIIGAGNNADDCAFTHTIPAPLTDRTGEVELTVSSIEDWSDWGVQNGIDSRIIGFLNMKPSNLHHVNFDDNQKHVTPRSWQRLSSLINGITDWETFTLACCSAIGEGIAREFVAFCKLKDKLKLEELIKNPDGIKNITDISIKYLLISAVAERYKDKKIKFVKIIEISKALDDNNSAEFVALLWRLCSSYTPVMFKKDFRNSPSDDDMFFKKYGRFLID